jgi:phage terminase small subunit
MLLKSAAGNPMFNPLLSIARAAASDMLKYAAQFGLSPAARTRIASGLVGQIGDGKFAGQSLGILKAPDLGKTKDFSKYR